MPSTVSRISSTELEAAIVATELPGMRVRTSSTLAASPPRAGMTAFSATPAA